MTLTDADFLPGSPEARASALVQLATISPLLGYLKARSYDVDQLMEAQGLTLKAAKDPSRLVQAEVVYRLLESTARAIGDPWLGVHVGEQLDLQAWPITQDALKGGETLGQILTGLVLSTGKFTASARHRLEIGPAQSSYCVERTFRPRQVPLQNIGFTFATFLRILDLLDDTRATGDVVLETPSALALPLGYRGLDIRETGSPVQVIRFPSQLLRSRAVNRLARIPATEALLERPSLTRAIAAVAPEMLNRHEDNLRQAVAEAIGLAPAELEAGLSVLGTSLASELRRARLALACDALKTTDTPITDIAAQLGFSAAGNFSRFFKSTTGETPRAYRQRLRRVQTGKR
ncbi:helix-turn-helix domain-containing protein [Tropicimonas aquimaris]|uniref:Helix-turn-helix domain-containing protein n=1 Tax=Tropicimonas aquimaris TaxID=914152 RepID=A0ABW3IQR0_9RHOB